MSFEDYVQSTLGNCEIYRFGKCTVCGNEEVYYVETETNELVGRACEICNHIQSFDN